MRLGTGPAPLDPAGTRVLIDVRPLQDPERAPVTAAYLRRLLAAYAAEPLPGESFVALLDLGAEDPTAGFPGLALAGRRRLPPTRIFRSGALTLDPFFVRGAGLGAGRGATAAGAVGVVAHAVAGALPIGPGLPVVATLLDLASWELPEQYQRTPAARFGQRLRAQLLRDAACVLVGSDAVAATAIRLLRLRPARVRIVPLAGDDALRPPDPAGTPDGDASRARLAAERERFGLPERYFVYPGRYDARQDLGTLLEALARLASAGRPARLAKAVGWPPRVLVLGASPDDRAALARQAFEAGVGDALAFAPGLAGERAALLRAGAWASLHPVLADGSALPVLDALAMGTPIVGSAVGAVPEAVGSAGLLVPPRDPDRLAAALRAAWAEERVHRAIAEVAAERAAPGRRTWADVARGTREAYVAAAATRS
ncbi:MAG TPA: glycosyltransferase [Candidatus Limnocylindrales bacterium]|jgi:glycosyltransferase involved in cell wall biosynthesis